MDIMSSLRDFVNPSIYSAGFVCDTIVSMFFSTNLTEYLEVES
jgi:hypothetical protein